MFSPIMPVIYDPPPPPNVKIIYNMQHFCVFFLWGLDDWPVFLSGWTNNMNKLK